jgi:hypothetical protein
MVDQAQMSQLSTANRSEIVLEFGPGESMETFAAGLRVTADRIAKITEPIARLGSALRHFAPPAEEQQWAAVKPYFEAAPPSEKRRLGNMTIRQAFAVIARQGRAVVGRFQGGRSTAARSPRRRSIRSSRAKARAPGGSDDPDASDLEVVPVARFLRDVWRSLEGAA